MSILFVKHKEMSCRIEEHQVIKSSYCYYDSMIPHGIWTFHRNPFCRNPFHRSHFAEGIFYRRDISPKVHFTEGTFHQKSIFLKDISPISILPKSISLKSISSNGHFTENGNKN